MAGSVISNTEPAELDWFTAAAFAIISAAFLLPPQFYYLLSAFLAPFLALAIALGVTRLKDATWLAAGGKGRGPLTAGLAGALIGTMTMVQVSHEAQTRASMAGPALTAVRQLIPPGACLITDQVSVSIAINRPPPPSPAARCSSTVGTGYP